MFALTLLIGVVSCATDRSGDLGAQDRPEVGDYIIKIKDDEMIMKSGEEVSLKGLTSGGRHILIFTRHAEKDTIGLDPGLSRVGNKRAEFIRDLLEDVPVKKVYTTHYRRTYLTAVPLLESKNAQVLRYEPGDQNLFADQLMENKAEVALIVGHSNSIPRLLNLMCEEQVEGISEEDYDNLFIAVLSDKEVSQLYKLKYKP